MVLTVASVLFFFHSFLNDKNRVFDDDHSIPSIFFLNLSFDSLKGIGRFSSGHTNLIIFEIVKMFQKVGNLHKWKRSQQVEKVKQNNLKHNYLWRGITHNVTFNLSRCLLSYPVMLNTFQFKVFSCFFKTLLRNTPIQ